MLKITTRTDVTGTILELEGKLAGPWVKELEGCWRLAVMVDAENSDIHRSTGKKLLTEMHQRIASLFQPDSLLWTKYSENFRSKALPRSRGVNRRTGRRLDFFV